MAKVHPQVGIVSISSKQEVFTLWMKSLILSSNGCTVFDSNGRIVYRVDNYNHKCSSRVCVMDAAGKALFNIVKKKYSLRGLWEGYRSPCASDQNDKPGFRVSKILRIMGFLRGNSLCKILVGLDRDQSYEYGMENQIGKSCCKIFDNFGVLAAEVKRKITTSGVVLGEDVLTMVVEPHIDHSLIVGLVVVFGLIHHIL